jgi:hypothetical protein
MNSYAHSFNYVKYIHIGNYAREILVVFVPEKIGFLL